MKWLSFFSLVMLLVSCNKESMLLDTVEIDSQTTNAIHDIQFVDDNTAYYCGGELWQSGVVGKSTDGGQSWEVILETDNILFAIAFKNELEGIAVGFSGRVWRTEDGGTTWSLKESAPEYPNFNDAVFIAENKVLMSAGFNYYNGGFASYFFNGQTFGDSLFNQEMQALHFFDNQKGIMAGYGALFNTNNGGQDWQANSVRGDYFKGLAFNEQNEGLLIGYQGKIFHSTDKGLNWEKNDKKVSFFTTKGNLESVSVSENKAFIAGQNGALFFSNNFLNSEWIVVKTRYEDDFFFVHFTSPSSGIIAGGNGRILAFTL